LLFKITKRVEGQKTVQDILGFDFITNEMIVIDKLTYRMVLEVSKVNLKSKDRDETAQIIHDFKETVNVPFSLQWQRITRILDIEPYTNQLEREAKESNDEIEREFLPIYKKHLLNEIESKKMMSSKTFLVIGYRIGQQTDEVDKSFKSLLQSFLPKKNLFARMSEEEKVQEVSQIFRTIEDGMNESLRKIRSSVRRLSDDELYMYLYETNRKNLALVQRWGNFPLSVTPIEIREGTH